MIKELNFERDGLTIAGKLYLPDTHADTYPIVIMCHGFTANMNSNAEEAKWYNDHGIAAYIFDFIGGGYKIKSSLTMREMSVLTEAKDLQTVITGIKALDCVDETKIFLQGKSQGGFVSAYIAGKQPDDVAGLILYYPAFVIQDDAKQRVGTIYETSIMGHEVGLIYNEDALSFDIFDVIGGYTDKVLIIHGDVDDIVPFRYAQQAFDVYHDVDLICMKNAAHGFYHQQKLAAFDYALSYIKQKNS